MFFPFANLKRHGRPLMLTVTASLLLVTIWRSLERPTIPVTLLSDEQLHADAHVLSRKSVDAAWDIDDGALQHRVISNLNTEDNPKADLGLQLYMDKDETAPKPNLEFKTAGKTSESPDAPCLTKELVERFINEQRELLLMIVDSGYSSMAENFYLTSILKHNLTNHLFVAMDKELCETLSKNYKAINCIVCSSNLNTSSSASVFGQLDFRNKMGFRSTILLRILEFGIRVLHCDTDIYLYKNPFLHINCSFNDCDIAFEVDEEFDICGGFLYLNPTNTTLHIIRRRVYYREHMPDNRDQAVINKIIKDELNYSVNLVPLPKETFINGQLFYGKYRIDFKEFRDNPDYVMMHNNFIRSFEAKRYRFRENGFWMFDDGYYSNPTTKYVILDYNSGDMSALDIKKQEQIEQLRFLLTVGEMLNRVPIVPRFERPNIRDSNLVTRFGCDGMRKFEEVFHNYRENVFLEHPKVPESVRSSQSLTYCIEGGEWPKNRDKCDAILSPRDPKIGPTQREIENWFQNSMYAVLRISQVLGPRPKFANEEDEKLFQEKLDSFNTSLYNPNF